MEKKNRFLDFKMKGVIYLISILFISFIPEDIRAFNINPLHKKGYYGNVSISAGAGLDRTVSCNLLTSHGCSFGNGFYCGFGTGLQYNADKITLPIFADVRYSILDKLVSPFVAVRAGGVHSFKDKGMSSYLSPYFGIDLGRVSLTISWECITGKRIKANPSYIYESKISHQAFLVGVSYSF